MHGKLAQEYLSRKIMSAKVTNFAARNIICNFYSSYEGEFKHDILERTSANHVRKGEKFKFKSSSGRAGFRVLKGTIAQYADIVDIEKKKTKQSHNKFHEVTYSPSILCNCKKHFFIF